MLAPFGRRLFERPLFESPQGEASTRADLELDNLLVDTDGVCNIRSEVHILI